jgi:hypothetical protein
MGMRLKSVASKPVTVEICQCGEYCALSGFREVKKHWSQRSGFFAKGAERRFRSAYSPMILIALVMR